MSLVPASTDRASTPANDETTHGAVAGSALEIGRKADTAPFLLPGTDAATLAGGAPVAAAGSFTKPCERCGKPFPKHYSESPSRFLMRRFCSNSCAQIGRKSVPIVERGCGLCERPMVQRDDETASNFRRRVYCSKVCGNKAAGRKVAQKNAELRASNEAQRASGRSFPTPKDKGREKQLYRGERYDAPGRVIDLAPVGYALPLRPSTYVYSEARS